MLKDLLIHAPKNTLIQFIRNMIAGIIGTAVDFSILIFCEEVFLLGEVLSTIIGFFIGLAVNYIICRFWVFPESRNKKILFDFSSFIAIGVIGLLLTQVIIAPFSEQGIFGEGYFVSHSTFGSRLLPENQYYIIGKALAVILVYFWNFFTRKKILYRNFQNFPDRGKDRQ